MFALAASSMFVPVPRKAPGYILEALKQAFGNLVCYKKLYDTAAVVTPEKLTNLSMADVPAYDRAYRALPDDERPFHPSPTTVAARKLDDLLPS